MAAAALCGLLASYLCFAEFFTSRFDRIAGNRGDARLIIYLHEHWYDVFRGQQAWLSPTFFYPVKNVLAFSLTVFLQSVPYSLCRLAGLDPYAAFEAVLILLSLVGYGFTVALLRRLGANRALAIVGGLLFAYSNLFHIWALAAQNYTVMLIPVVLVCTSAALERRARRRGQAALLLAAAAALFSLILFSDFYTGWIFIFIASLGLAIAILKQPSLLPRVAGAVKTEWRLILTLILAASLAMVPFVITYGPAIGREAHRSFEEVLRSTMSFADLLNVNRANRVWGRALEPLSASYRDVGFAYGLTPGLLLAFLAVTGWMLIGKAAAPLDRGGPRFPLFSGAAIAVLAGWALMCKSGSFSLWYWVWRLVPGASAIRVTPRLQFELSLIVVVTVVLGLSGLWGAAADRLGRGGGRPRDRAALWSIGLLSVLLLLEQASALQTHGISRRQEDAQLGIACPAFFCPAFFITEPEGVQHEHPIALQLDAMLVSQRCGVPTVNGYSGFAPPGFEAILAWDPDYLAQIDRWAKANHLEHLCALDIATGSWRQDALTPRATAGPGAAR